MLDLTYGVDRIYREDMEAQNIFLEAVANNVRHMPVEALKERRMFYVPNDDYLRFFYGSEALSREYDMYITKGMCKYYKRLILPIWNFRNGIVGFCGYDDGSEIEDKESHIKYLYSAKRVFKKERFMYIRREEFRQALLDNYIMIVDGMFDQVRLSTEGYNATSLMSTEFTKFHKEYLKRIKHKIVIRDNDEAGELLFRQVKKCYGRDVIEIRQTEVKDIDLYLRKDTNKKKFKEAFDRAKDTGFRVSVEI